MSSPVRTLVFVPLREEMVHIDAIAQGQGYVPTRTVFDPRDDEHTYGYVRGNRMPGLVTFKVMADMGNTRTAAFVAAGYNSVRPDVMLMAGLAGSLDPAAARLGDVFVTDMAKFVYPDKVRDIDAATERFAPFAHVPPGGQGPGGITLLDERKRIMGDDSVLRYRRDIASSPGTGALVAAYVAGLAMRVPLPLEVIGHPLLNGLPPAAQARCLNPAPSVRGCVVLASDMVVDSQAYIDFLQDRNQHEDIGLYANKIRAGDREADDRNRWRLGPIPIVDMESYGYFKLVEALHKSGTALRAFAVRGVSDFAADKSVLDGASKQGIRRIAARNAAVVTLDLLRAIETSELSGQP